jgi:protein-S-isoprenylcysteine O-methyltransferase Ste14
MTIAKRCALTSVLYIAAQALCLFGGAGRIDIPEFWIYLALTAGPYRVVRHPAYAIALLGCPANGLALGFWLAAAIGAVAIPLLLWRCIGEDRICVPACRAMPPGCPGGWFPGCGSGRSRS